MKAYKSLEAYHQITEGWVRDVKVNLNENGLNVVRGKAVQQRNYCAQRFVALSLKQLSNHYTVFNIFII